VTNLASRLCSEAKGGQILIEQKTMASVEGTVLAEALEEVMLKGIGYPLPIFNVTRARG
jgi:adenylate cyclase